VGFDWQTAEQVLAKVDEELREVREAIDGASASDVEGEIGDLLFSVVNLARHLNVDPEAALRGTNLKFERRFGWMEERLAESGKSPESVDLARLEQLWREAKQEESLGTRGST
jgi:ATP diphosphatase